MAKVTGLGGIFFKARDPAPGSMTMQVVPATRYGHPLLPIPAISRLAHSRT